MSRSFFPTQDKRRRILLLLDSVEIRREVTSYSVELARRMGAEIYLLMLLRAEYPEPPSASGPAPDVNLKAVRREGERLVEACVRQIREEEVEAVGTVRQGDPSSELLKFLAEFHPFQAVVWGGKERILRHRRIRIRGHWLERIRNAIDCPLVVPSLRREGH